MWKGELSAWFDDATSGSLTATHFYEQVTKSSALKYARNAKFVRHEQIQEKENKLRLLN